MTPQSVSLCEQKGYNQAKPLRTLLCLTGDRSMFAHFRKIWPPNVREWAPTPEDTVYIFYTKERPESTLTHLGRMLNELANDEPRRNNVRITTVVTVAAETFESDARPDWQRFLPLTAERSLKFYDTITNVKDVNLNLVDVNLNRRDVLRERLLEQEKLLAIAQDRIRRLGGASIDTEKKRNALERELVRLRTERGRLFFQRTDDNSHVMADFATLRLNTFASGKPSVRAMQRAFTQRVAMDVLARGSAQLVRIDVSMELLETLYGVADGVMEVVLADIREWLPGRDLRELLRFTTDRFSLATTMVRYEPVVQMGPRPRPGPIEAIGQHVETIELRFDGRERVSVVELQARRRRVEEVVGDNATMLATRLTDNFISKMGRFVVSSLDDVAEDQLDPQRDPLFVFVRLYAAPENARDSVQDAVKEAILNGSRLVDIINIDTRSQTLSRHEIGIYPIVELIIIGHGHKPVLVIQRYSPVPRAWQPTMGGSLLLNEATLDREDTAWRSAVINAIKLSLLPRHLWRIRKSVPAYKATDVNMSLRNEKSDSFSVVQLIVFVTNAFLGRIALDVHRLRLALEPTELSTWLVLELDALTDQLKLDLEATKVHIEELNDEQTTLEAEIETLEKEVNIREKVRNAELLVIVEVAERIELEMQDLIAAEAAAEEAAADGDEGEEDGDEGEEEEDGEEEGGDGEAEAGDGKGESAEAKAKATALGKLEEVVETTTDEIATISALILKKKTAKLKNYTRQQENDWVEFQAWLVSNSTKDEQEVALKRSLADFTKVIKTRQDAEVTFAEEQDRAIADQTAVVEIAMTDIGIIENELAAAISTLDQMKIDADALAGTSDDARFFQQQQKVMDAKVVVDGIEKRLIEAKESLAEEEDTLETIVEKWSSEWSESSEDEEAVHSDSLKINAGVRSERVQIGATMRDRMKKAQSVVNVARRDQQSAIAALNERVRSANDYISKTKSTLEASLEESLITIRRQQQNAEDSFIEETEQLRLQLSDAEERLEGAMKEIATIAKNFTPNTNKLVQQSGDVTVTLQEVLFALKNVDNAFVKVATMKTDVEMARGGLKIARGDLKIAREAMFKEKNEEDAAVKDARNAFQNRTPQPLSQQDLIGFGLGWLAGFLIRKTAAKAATEAATEALTEEVTEIVAEVVKTLKTLYDTNPSNITTNTTVTTIIGEVKDAVNESGQAATATVISTIQESVLSIYSSLMEATLAKQIVVGVGVSALVATAIYTIKRWRANRQEDEAAEDTLNKLFAELERLQDAFARLTEEGLEDWNRVDDVRERLFQLNNVILNERTQAARFLHEIDERQHVQRSISPGKMVLAVRPQSRSNDAILEMTKLSNRQRVVVDNLAFVSSWTPPGLNLDKNVLMFQVLRFMLSDDIDRRTGSVIHPFMQTMSLNMVAIDADAPRGWPDIFKDSTIYREWKKSMQ